METVVGSIHDRYRVMSKKGEGTFSEVVKCQRISDGTYCAVKRMKGQFSSLEQVDNLREVQCLRRLYPHPHIIDLKEVLFDEKTKNLDIACELMDMNIYERIRGRRHHLPEQLVKSYVYQLTKALDHMHRNGIFHRDVKPENILIKDDVLKLADFGSCRGIYSKPPFTEYISTRWYRAPECLLTDGHYNFKMDMWSVGCVMFEIMSLYPLFPGSNEIDQLAKIHDIMGTPSTEVLDSIRKKSPPMKFDFPTKQGKGLTKMLPQASSECLDLLKGLLSYDPERRLSARQALRHPYFKDLRSAEKRQRKASNVAQQQSSSDSVDRRASKPDTGRVASKIDHGQHRRRRKPAEKKEKKHTGQVVHSVIQVKGHHTSTDPSNKKIVQLKPLREAGTYGSKQRSGKPARKVKRHHMRKKDGNAAKSIVSSLPAINSIGGSSPKVNGKASAAELRRYHLPTISSKHAT